MTGNAFTKLGAEDRSCPENFDRQDRYDHLIATACAHPCTARTHTRHESSRTQMETPSPTLAYAAPPPGSRPHAAIGPPEGHGAHAAGPRGHRTPTPAREPPAPAWTKPISAQTARAPRKCYARATRRAVRFIAANAYIDAARSAEAMLYSIHSLYATQVRCDIRRFRSARAHDGWPRTIAGQHDVTISTRVIRPSQVRLRDYSAVELRTLHSASDFVEKHTSIG